MKRSGPPQRRTPLTSKGGGLKRSGIKRTAPLKASTGRATITAEVKPKPRRKDTGPDQATRDIVHGRSGGWCELRLPGCTGLAEHVHHRLGRKDGGRRGEMRERLNGPGNLVDACAHCHGLVTSPKEPKLTEYRNAGYVLIEGQDGREVPILTIHSPTPILLRDDGTWVPAEEVS